MNTRSYVFLLLAVLCSFFVGRFSLKKGPLTRLIGKSYFTAKDTIIKPQVFFHGSPNRNISILEPRAIKTAKKQEGPIVYATSDMGAASSFFVNWDDSWCNLGGFDFGPFCFVCKDKARFLKGDNGGALYVVLADTFSYLVPSSFFWENLPDVAPVWIWISKEPIKPLTKLEFDSALNTMLQFGVQVFFVDEATFASIQNAKDDGRALLMELERSGKSENHIRNINPKPLFDYEEYLKEKGEKE